VHHVCAVPLYTVLQDTRNRQRIVQVVDFPLRQLGATNDLLKQACNGVMTAFNISSEQQEHGVIFARSQRESVALCGVVVSMMEKIA